MNWNKKKRRYNQINETGAKATISMNAFFNVVYTSRAIITTFVFYVLGFIVMTVVFQRQNIRIVGSPHLEQRFLIITYYYCTRRVSDENIKNYFFLRHDGIGNGLF